MLPNPTEVDRLFYEDVWAPQELQHGVILDTVQSDLAFPPAPADLDRVSAKIKLVGALSHLINIEPCNIYAIPLEHLAELPNCLVLDPRRDDVLPRRIA